MLEIDLEYDNGKRETLKLESGDQIEVPEDGRILAVRIDGIPCQVERVQ